MIQSLIDKQDTFEIVRDQIAAILKLEIASQMALATGAGKDPALWELRIFSERANPWEQFQDVPDDRSPLVNVWYDGSTFDPSASNVLERQTAEAVFNLDCYGYGVSSDDPGGGHNPGDRGAAFEAHRAARLVRNIMMAAEYTYLDLRGTVAGRWPQSISVFQPELNSQSVQNVVGARLAFRVRFNEFAPQVEGDDLEYLSATVRRTEDGEIVILADYDYT